MNLGSIRLAAIPILAAAAFAQATSVVQISGVITDASGGPISGAALKATQTDTGMVRSSASESDGTYVLSNLPVGPYRLEAGATRFRPYLQTGLGLQINTNPVGHLTLHGGSPSQERGG